MATASPASESEIFVNDEIPAEPPRRVIKSELASEEKSRIKELHTQFGSALVRQQLNNVVAFSISGVGLYCWMQGYYPITVLLWFVTAHFFHTKPLSLHDASHGTLDSNRKRNAMYGLFCGTASLVPLSVYRFAHAYHHGYMATEKDPELWPFNQTNTSRPFRMMCAFLEIVFGFLYTPWLFARSLFVCGKVKKSVRQRVILEYGLIVVFWGTVLGFVHYQGWWEEFLILYFAPYTIAAMYQTLNKYTEHMGLLGDTVLSGTRTVIPKGRVHKTVSNMMQNVDHHGTHHRFAQIPYYHLPEASEIVYGDGDPENPVFDTYHAAFFDMLPTLWNPRIGSQWKEAEENQAASN